MCTKKEKKAAKKYDKMVDNYEDARESIEYFYQTYFDPEMKMNISTIKKSIKQLFKYMDKEYHRRIYD